MLALACALFGTAPPASGPDPSEILLRAEDVRSPDLDYAVDLRLEVTDPRSVWKERVATYTLIAHGKDHSLVLMREPVEFHPGVLLIADGLYWMLLPHSDKALQLSPRHVLNGDISNGDLARANLAALYAARIEGLEGLQGASCYRLALERKSALAFYPKLRAWIGTDGFLPRQFEYYGETGALLRTATYEDYRSGEIGLRSMRIVVENKLRPGERSVLRFSHLRRFDTSRLSFTPESLPALRDAFLAALGPKGEQAEPEEVVRRLPASRP